MRRFVLLSFAVAWLLVPATAFADRVFHTQQLALEAVGEASGSGFVVDVHPNGPLNFAQERYALRGADAGASYQVFLVIDASAIPNCDSLRILMAADLQTNAAGNGTTPADFVFRPGGIPPCLRNTSFPIHWEVELGGTLTYQSDVIVDTLD
jgi:hypothetical protein